MPWMTADAPTAEELSKCVQCGLCLPACPTFRLTGRETASPRGRLMAMSAVANGAPVDETFDDMMSFCLQCRACEAVCPSFAPFGRAMEGARAELAVQRPAPVARARRIAVGRGLGIRSVVKAATTAAALVQRFGVPGMIPASVRTSMDGMRPLDMRPETVVGKAYPAIGPARGSVGLLAGCVMDPWFGEVHTATIDVLRHAGYDVVVPSDQTCCGALAAHDGAADEARRLAARNVAAFAAVDLVVVNSAGCGAHMKDYGHWAAAAGAGLAEKTRDITEVVAEAIDDQRLPTFDTPRGPVAMQDPCHLRHAQRITSAPRQVVAAAGYTPVEIDPAGMCCGAAGMYSVVHPDTSAELGRRKAAQVVASAAAIVSSANPGCEMQLRSHLGEGHRVAHPVELYAEIARDTPDWAER